MKRFSSVLSGVVLCAVMAPVVSMAAGSGQLPINQREHNQQARINQGIKSGELTRKETSKLESEEARIRVNERFDKRQNGGKLTPAERVRLQRQSNQASRNIYRDKHNHQVQH
jgi:hypothetical protein